MIVGILYPGKHLAAYHTVCFLFRYLDILGQPVWQEITGIDDSELKELAESLPMVVLQSRAPSNSQEVWWSLFALEKVGVK